MNKPEIKKLKYPLWFTIVFYVLTLAVPLVLIALEGFNSPSKTFRITFGLIITALIAWTFIRKFLLKDLESKLIAQKESLQHDYRIEVGNAENTKWLWFQNELWLTIIQLLSIVLIGLLFILISVGIETAVVKVKGACAGIALSYIVAYIIKFILIFCLRGKEQEE